MGLTIKVPAAFKDLQRRMEAVARGGLAAEFGKVAAAGLNKEVMDEFRESRDPYGKAWAPVKRNRARDRNARAKRAKAGKPAKADKPLIDTGRMRASVVARSDGRGNVRVAIPTEYASVHQYGGTVKEHGRKGGTLAVDDRGRITSKKRAHLVLGDGQIKHKYARVRFYKGFTMGSYKIPRRQMLPEADTGGLGDRWTMSLNKSAAHVINKHFGKKG